MTILEIFIIIFYSRQTFTNIHKLLRPNGVAIINFLIQTPLFDIYEQLSKYKKYEGYMRDVKQFISPYHHEKRPLELVNKYCTNAGFIINHMEIREKIFVYRNDEQLKGTKLYSHLTNFSHKNFKGAELIN